MFEMKPTRTRQEAEITQKSPGGDDFQSDDGSNFINLYCVVQRVDAFLSRAALLYSVTLIFSPEQDKLPSASSSWRGANGSQQPDQERSPVHCGVSFCLISPVLTLRASVS